MNLTVYIGYDDSERAAYDKAERSIRRHSDVRIVPLRHDWLMRHGLFTRPVCRIPETGQLYDVLSDAPQSTEFATTRFLTPLLHQTGWALFMDCDVVVYTDVREILHEARPEKAVMVVKHQHNPTEQTKMCGLAQTRYARKNWSSVMLFNCDHEANRRLTVRDINRLPGRDLHGFSWLADEEVGGLSKGWNWLVGVEDKPDPLHVAHFTLGGPWLEGWKRTEHDELWDAA